MSVSSLHQRLIIASVVVTGNKLSPCRCYQQVIIAGVVVNHLIDENPEQG
jgi:hypothetical protein